MDVHEQLDAARKLQLHREASRGHARNVRRAESRRKKRDLLPMQLPGEEHPCACLGIYSGELSYGVKPAVCGHWFTVTQLADGSFKLGMLRGITITGGPDTGTVDFSKARPIRNLETGRDTPLRATHTVSFREKLVKGLPKAKPSSVHALKNAHKEQPTT